MHIHALHLGPIQTLQYDGKAVRTAGNKRAVESAWVTRLGLVGNEQADRRYHGGPDRALCAYGWEHYAHNLTDCCDPFPRNGPTRDGDQDK